jgi:UDP-N-acetylglucosamine 2-epimerase (non-hydrolysing)
MHRAENTQSRDALVSIIKAFEVLSDVTVVFPIHPRTARILGEFGLYSRLQSLKNVKLVEPTGYVDFISLLRNSKTLVTDSGGAQKEAYLLKIPCITIRENTEWVETVESGWNILTGLDTIKIVRAVREWNPKSAYTPSIFGDGKASQIIKKSIKSILL